MLIILIKLGLGKGPGSQLFPILGILDHENCLKNNIQYNNTRVSLQKYQERHYTKSNSIANCLNWILVLNFYKDSYGFPHNTK